MHILSIAIHLTSDDLRDGTPNSAGRYPLNDETAARIQSELGHTLEKVQCYLELSSGHIITGYLRFCISGSHALDFNHASIRTKKRKSSTRSSPRSSARTSSLA